MKQVNIRNLKLEDAEILAQYANNVKVWNHLRNTFPHPYRLEHAEQFIGSCQKEKPALTFAIDFNKEFSGIIGLVAQKDVYSHSMELGYWIAEPYWGNGIAKKAVNLICSFAFDELKIERIFASVFDFNQASVRVLEKNQFQLEGKLRKAYVKNGVSGDEYRFGRLKSD